jgi:cellulose synthase/poly-beta-1,6-N-acetylglucosamine synthase-like glycosyltransferase
VFLITICILIVSIQALYLLFFLWGLSRKEKEPIQSPHPVSVIVCAHDEEQNLRELIPLLLEQDHPEFEIIIVEDRCNDGTYDYLREAVTANNKLKMVRVVHKPDHISGKKFGLTLGIKAARYEWILLTDADCRPVGTHWITHMTERYNDQTQIVLGYSPYLRMKGLLNSFIRFESLLTGLQFISLARLGRPYMGVGRNLVYTKSLFLKNKGFNEHLEIMGGDDDLFVNRHATKFNTQVCMDPQAITISKPKLNWSDFLHQKLRHLSVGKRYKIFDKVILSTFSGMWILTWFFVIPALFFSTSVNAIASVLFLRWILLILLLQRGSVKLGGSFESWKTPILDIIFAFYYLVTGLRALVVKRIRWKK